jgi:hypothetical protein
LDGDPATWGTLLGWWCVHSLGKVAGEAATASRHLQGETGFAERSRSWIDEWLLGKVLVITLQDLGLDENMAWRAVAVIKLLTSHQEWSVLHPAPPGLVLRPAFSATALRASSGVGGPVLRPPEAGSVGATPDDRLPGAQARVPASAQVVLENLLKDDEVQQFLRVNRYGDVLWFNKEAFEQLLWLLLVVAVQITASRPVAEAASAILAAYEVVQQLHQAEERSGYQLEELVRLLQSNPA